MSTERGTQDNDLLPCPFCGGPVSMQYTGSSDWEVDCRGTCEVETKFWVSAPKFGYGVGETNEAKRRWNTRHAADAWKQKILEMLVVRHIYKGIHDNDPWTAINALIDYEVKSVADAKLESQQGSDMRARVPEGWQIVPKEPTDEMLPEYGHAAYDKQLYRDMIARAPKPGGNDEI